MVYGQFLQTFISSESQGRSLRFSLLSPCVSLPVSLCPLPISLFHCDGCYWLPSSLNSESPWRQTCKHSEGLSRVLASGQTVKNSLEEAEGSEKSAPKVRGAMPGWVGSGAVELERAAECPHPCSHSRSWLWVQCDQLPPAARLLCPDTETVSPNKPSPQLMSSGILSQQQEKEDTCAFVLLRVPLCLRSIIRGTLTMQLPVRTMLNASSRLFGEKDNNHLDLQSTNFISHCLHASYQW